jgi:hypothetical protein
MLLLDGGLQCQMFCLFAWFDDLFLLPLFSLHHSPPDARIGRAICNAAGLEF